ncbi:helix-hairpin-helix protein [Tamaricihabitans halophyticus]|uniref:Helix-hairpin-helix protein n=1 Tax=Tamaricihabitans halophyticus TaxID=1262583 RepID=A0A4R2RA31_9PSEU|nr:helix-hairpin-helix domain-containing protein [Tamaricihabitans halophyticus]TCP56265.1 helix-hairpin-helix protein [Tamaricihabitans halophyticus]
MTTLAQLRKAALALPEVTEGTHFGMVAFAVRDKGFASVTRDGQVQLRLTSTDTDAAIDAHASGERLERNGKPIGFRIVLADINGKDLNALVRAAWAHRAPKRLANDLAAAEAGADQPDCALPAAIGRPATRALLGAGWDTLEKIATHSQAELLDLHGVGPKAVRILTEELTDRGLAFREP